MNFRDIPVDLMWFVILVVLVNVFSPFIFWSILNLIIQYLLSDI